MTTQFRVKLSNFSGKNLLSKDSNGKSDPFLNGNFDNFKTFKTETIKNDLNPNWKFNVLFYYDTRYPDKLDKKVLKLDCYDYDVIGSNDFIGSCTIDLQTLATGPISHDILLRDGGKPAGRLEFDCEMEQISEVIITMKDVEITGLPVHEQDGTADPYLSYYYTGSGKDGKRFKSTTIRNSTTPSWKEMEQLYFQATLRELVNESIMIEVAHNKRLKVDPVLGSCSLPFTKYLCRADGQPIKFREPLTRNGQPAGFIEGILSYKDVPKFAQMVGGKHTESGITGGKPLLPDLPMPKGIINATPLDPNLSNPNSVTQTPPVTGNQYPTLPPAPVVQPTPHPNPVVTSNPVTQPESPKSPYAELSPYQPNIPVSLGGTFSATMAIAKMQNSSKSSTNLPPGWEERKDPESGRSYYVDHNTKNTHWELPANFNSSPNPSTPSPNPTPSSPNPTSPTPNPLPHSNSQGNYPNPYVTPTPTPNPVSPTPNPLPHSNSQGNYNPYVTPTPSLNKPLYPTPQPSYPMPPAHSQSYPTPSQSYPTPSQSYPVPQNATPFAQSYPTAYPTSPSQPYPVPSQPYPVPQGYPMPPAQPYPYPVTSPYPSPYPPNQYHH